MHEKFRRRLADLEEAHRLASGPVQTINIGFRNGDGSKVAPMYAKSIGTDFLCDRREGEDEDAFKARANTEALAADPGPLQILIFSDTPWKDRSIASCHCAHDRDG
jgi:hypothetical protein